MENETHKAWKLSREEILGWLRCDDEAELARLWEKADDVRSRCVGDEVHLRGLTEISNYCQRSCAYCGLRKQNDALERYRMTEAEVLECASFAVEYGYGSLVLQAGEDAAWDAKSVSSLVRAIKKNYSLAVTLSLGEQPREVLKVWREAGADRYLLRFETSNKSLFKRVHPPLRDDVVRDRVEQLKLMRMLGYEIGSGVMIGLPGQSWDDLVNDLLLFRELELDMIGVGPFIANPATPMGADDASRFALSDSEQVPATELMTYKVLALTRLLCPLANIPATTALATLNPTSGRELGLRRGANVIMPNVTPVNWRMRYEIYPGKACLTESARQCAACIVTRIKAIGRKPGTGEGASPAYLARL